MHLAHYYILLMRYYRGILISALCLFSYGISLAQPAPLLDEAERLLNRRVFGRAIEVYAELLGQYRNRLSAEQVATVQTNLAYAYRQVGETQKAERLYNEWFKETQPEAQKPQQLLAYAQVLADNGKFQEAQQQYERYLRLKDLQPEDKLQAIPVGAGQQVAGRKRTTRYRLETLTFNTDNEEFSPAFYKNGLVYVSGKKGSSAIETTGSGGGSGYLDLFYIPDLSQIKVQRILNPDGTDSKPVAAQAVRKADPEGRRLGADAYTRASANDSRTPAGFETGVNISRGLGYDNRPVNPIKQFSENLNTRYHEGPATFLHDGSGIIFTRNNYNGGKAKKSADGINKLKLYAAEYRNGGWTNIKELPFNSDEYSVGHPALSKDDKLLFFASDKPGGFGGTDIYVSRWENGNWSKPVNLGKDINTKGSELFPFVDENGNLYFSTDGRRGLGGLDIFYAVMEGTTVSAIERLEDPINSPQDDFGLITDGSRRIGYFSSNRQKSGDDIYRFVREGAISGCRALTVRLFDPVSDQPLDSVSVTVTAQAGDQAVQQLTTDKNGLLHLCLEPNSNFTFSADLNGYPSSKVGFSTRYLTDDRPSKLEIPLIKVEAGTATVVTDTASAGTRLEVRPHVQGTILSETGNKPIAGVTVTLRNECNGKTMQVVTGPDGRYSFDLGDDCDYTLLAAQESSGTPINTVRKTLPRKARSSNTLAADLKMLAVGDVVTISNASYDPGSISISGNLMPELDKLIATMQQYPGLSIEVGSHTDSQGDARANLILSKRRANTIANYFVAKGISRKRVIARGYGESKLLNNCADGVTCTDAEHQRNRRTEFKVLSIK